MIQAAELYRAITEDKVFTVQVTELNGTVTELTVTPGEGDWNVPRRESGMQSYEWTIASAEGRELCAALGRCLRETDGWDHSVETLKPLLGGYGDWLDA